MILLISNKQDISLDFVVEELRQRHIPFHRLNTEDLPVQVVAEFPNDSVKIDGIDMNELRGVIHRGPGKPSFKLQFETSSAEEQESCVRYCTEQWSAFLESIFSIPDITWMNHPLADRLIHSKITQLQIAKRLGFDLPKTCITNDKNIALSFQKACKGEIIAKALGPALVEEKEASFFIYTTDVSDLSEFPEEEFQISPVIFQEKLFQKKDIRVTIVDDVLFAVEVRTSEGAVPLDWRTGKNLSFHTVQLPEKLSSMCKDYLKNCGLLFGAIDLLLFEDKYYFLEINSCGEWGWLQKGVGLPIANAIVNTIISRNHPGRFTCV